MRASFTLAALAALAPVALAGPQAFIQNNCPYDVYLWAVDIVRKPSSPSIIKAGSSYAEPYHSLTTGGVSLKLSRSTDITHPLQFEYTLAGGFIWYDGSHVDCRGAQCPFYADGVYLAASDPSCPTRVCKPNQECTGFYINWNDDINTLSCNPSASVNMYLCSQSATLAPVVAAAAAAPASAAGAIVGSGSGSTTAPVAVAAASAPEGAVTSAEPKKIQMEAIHGTVTAPRVRRHVHNHMRRHSHQ